MAISVAADQVQQSAVDHAKILVFVFQLEGTGIDRAALVREIADALERALPPSPPLRAHTAATPELPALHLSQPEEYQQFCTARGFRQDTFSAAVYNKLAASTLNPHGCPNHWYVLDPLRQRQGVRGVHNLAELAKMHREDIRKLCEYHTGFRLTKPAQRRFEQLEQWLKETFGLPFLD